MTLPRGWTLATVAELTGPGGLVSDGDWVESKDQDPDGEIRLTQLADVGEGEFRDRSSRFMSREAADRLRCTFLNPGDVLIARMPDPIGRACLFPGLAQPAVTAVDVMIWRSDGALADADWFARIVNSPAIRQAMADGAGGTTRQRIAGGRIKELELPLPPKAEQHRIVAKLDALTARLARARAELDRVNHLTARLRDEARQSAFAGELTRDLRGGTDANWALRPLQVIGNVVTGATPPSAEKAKLFGGNLPFFKPTDLDAGYHVSIPRETLTEAGATRSRVVSAGSTLVTCIGATIAKAGLARVRCAFNQQINAIVPDETQVEPRWLYWAVTAPAFRAAIIDNASATTMPIINKGRFQALELPVPPLREQVAIVERLETAFARADRLEAEAARARALLDRLESAILARAFRGELVPQDPEDEPASVLLERIRAARAAAPKARRGRRTRETADA